MDNQLVRHRQTTAPLGLGMLSLSVSNAPGMGRCSQKDGQISHLVVSPYFQTKDLRKVGTGRDTQLSLTIMDFLIDAIGVSAGNPYAIISWWNSSNTFQSSDFIFMTWADTKANGLPATIVTAVNAYASTNSLTVSSIRGTPGVVNGAPQAAIADAPADAVTNYNTITTLLGAVTGAVNDANTKQNAIATKLNTLLAELRTLGLISA